MNGRFPPVRASEVAFALLGLPLAVACGLYVAATVYLGGLLALTIVGLPLVAAALRGVRGLGGLHRWVVDRMLGESIAAPPPPVPDSRGPISWVKAGLTDGVAWKTVLYLLVRVPVGVLTAAGGGFVWVYGAFLFALPVLANWMGDGMTGLLVASSWALGVGLLVLAPWSTRWTADLNRWLARALLAPAAESQRLQQLERARGEVAEDATTTLRRIERDLHDGTQARLTAVGISLGLADEALADDDVDWARDLVAKARAQLGETVTELRQLARGINPVALDGGLEEALAVLVDDAGLPTHLEVQLPDRPSPAIERVVYFCVAELLANAARHSDADTALVSLVADGPTLRLLVADDGRGGATVGAGSGLSGLCDRIDAVDGTLHVDSPAGGPTRITAQLPVQL